MPSSSSADRSKALPLPLIPLPERPRPTANLPLPLTSFVGRERVVAGASGLLMRDDVRLLTLTGPGGVGKTRLALRLAAEVAPHFADGVVFVPLAAIADPESVSSAIARELGTREATDRPAIATLRTTLHNRHLLLMLDNFEHLASAAPMVTELLATSPVLKVLVASRGALHVQGEHEFAVSPLDLPDRTLRSLTLSDLAGVESVALFVQRARTVAPDFTLTEENAPVVAAIVERLDGLPLAIELAAAWSRMLPPASLLTHLDNRLALLTSRGRDLAPRLRSMRDAIAWSYDLLSPAEQGLFRRLAVFAGGFDLVGAEFIGQQGDAASPSVLHLVAALVDAGLLHRSGEFAGEPRFGMLETIREYALERLVIAGEELDAHRRHAAYFAQLTMAGHPCLGVGDEKGWLDLLETEEDNIWAVLDWSLTSSEIEAGVRVAGPTFLYWYIRKRRLSAARGWLARALADEYRSIVPLDVRGYGLKCASALAHLQNDLEPAVAMAEEALTIWQELELSGEIAFGHYLLAIPIYMQGDCGRAEQLYREAVARCRALGEHVNTAEALLGLAHIAIDRGDLPLAAAHYEEALALVEGVRYATSVAAIARTGYGFLMRGLDNLPRAHQFLCESLTAWHILADPGSIAVCLEAIAGVVCELGAPARAVNLLGAAEVIREQFGFPIPEGGRDTYRQTVAGVQSRLRMHDFAIAWNVGRGLSVDEAVLLAIEEPEAHAEPPPRRPKALGLTERERQVLRLIVAGHSNQAIADALFVSRRTITTHVASILRKLDVPTRSAAAARAEREQLI